MSFESVITELNSLLKQRDPKTFSSSWIYYHSPRIYRYIWSNVKTELGGIDWDRITLRLDKQFQRRWKQKRIKRGKPYRDAKEVKIVLKNYQSKLYVFLTPLDREDKLLQDAISISLVRIAQMGNLRAKEKLAPLLMLLIDQWIERSTHLYRWQGYRSEIDIQIDRCIRCYRFSGTFIGYLYRTLEYAARGLTPTYSLDVFIPNTEKRLIDKVVYDSETNQPRLY
jgi:hypothetical protein